MKNKLLVTFLICLASAVTAAPCLAGKNPDVYTSVTTGRRPVMNDNIQDARENAEKDALAVALQNAFSQLVPNQILAAHLDFFYDKILSRTKDYIITYKVLAGIENKGHYLVGVESKVDLQRLEKKLTDARILNANKNKPVVLFFISEQGVMDEAPRQWWLGQSSEYYSLAEQAIAGQLTRERFMVIGNTAQRPDPGFYNIRFRSASDIAAAISLGKQMKADMIFFGSAVCSEAINRMGEDKTFNARILLEGYNIATSQKAITSSVEAVVTSQDAALGNQSAFAKAAELSAKDLIEKVDAYWIDFIREEHAFEVRIEGMNFHPRYLAITQRFKQMPEIENIQPREMGANYAVLDMLYKGKPGQFANALVLKTFDDFGFEFLEVTEERVLIRLIEKAQQQTTLPDSSTETATDAPEQSALPE